MVRNQKLVTIVVAGVIAALYAALTLALAPLSFGAVQMLSLIHICNQADR